MRKEVNGKDATGKRVKIRQKPGIGRYLRIIRSSEKVKKKFKKW